MSVMLEPPHTVCGMNINFCWIGDQVLQYDNEMVQTLMQSLAACHSHHKPLLRNYSSFSASASTIMRSAILHLCASWSHPLYSCSTADGLDVGAHTQRSELVSPSAMRRG